MNQIESQIPSELWNHIFIYLTTEDKLSVRASCKYFQKLIDHWSLWKNWTVVLTFNNGGYSSKFWSTLRRRRVTRVIMKSNKLKHWRALAISLPAINTIVVEQSHKAAIKFLNDFPQLSRLAIRTRDFLFEQTSKNRAQQFTHLSICYKQCYPESLVNSINAVYQFTNLVHLSWHTLELFGVLVWTIQGLVSHLPRLQHLSLSMRQVILDSQAHLQENPTTNSKLSSLELVNYSCSSLPDDAMKLTPHLDSLAVFYNDSYPELQLEGRPTPHLKTWLEDLPNLTKLVIAKGPPLSLYVTSIPTTVTSLKLCVGELSPDDLAPIAQRVPNLIHLHLDVWPSQIGLQVAQIPLLFTKLQSLKLHYQNMSENDFVNLPNLKDLKYLEIQPCNPDLAMKLRVLTENKLEVSTYLRQRDVLDCPCVSKGF